VFQTRFELAFSEEVIGANADDTTLSEDWEEITDNWNDFTNVEKVVAIIFLLLLVFCPCCLIYTICIHKDRDGDVMYGHWDKHTILTPVLFILLFPVVILVGILVAVAGLLALAVALGPSDMDKEQMRENDEGRRRMAAWEEQREREGR